MFSVRAPPQLLHTWLHAHQLTHTYPQAVQEYIDAGAHPDDERNEVSFSVGSVGVRIGSDQESRSGEVARCRRAPVSTVLDGVNREILGEILATHSGLL